MLLVPRNTIGRSLRIAVLFAAAHLGLAGFVDSGLQAAALNWNSVDWTQTWGSGAGAASLSQTFTNVNASGVDITITIARGPNTLTSGEVQNGTTTPDDVNTPISHSYDTTKQALAVDVNYTSSANDYVKFTIAFSKTVSSVNFDLWDIDFANTAGTSTYGDVIKNFVATGGAAPTLTLLGSNNLDGNTSVDASLSGSGTSQVITGVSSLGSTTGLGNENDAYNSGDVNVKYNAGVTQISFEYWSSTAFANPTLQRIALGDVNFTVTPEVHPGLVSLAVCGLAVGFRSFRSRRA